MQLQIRTENKDALAPRCVDVQLSPHFLNQISICAKEFKKRLQVT